MRRLMRLLLRLARRTGPVTGPVGFVSGVLGAIDCAMLATGHAGLFPHVWQRVAAWAMFGGLVAIFIVGGRLKTRSGRERAVTMAQEAIDRARTRSTK